MLLVLLVLKVPKVNPAISASKVTEALLVALVLMVPQVLKVQLADKVTWVLKVLQALTVLTDNLVFPVQMEPRVQKVSVAAWVHEVLSDLSN